MKKFEIEFWEDAAKLNIYYANFVLSSSVIIHTLAFFFIDLKIVGELANYSLLLRLLPISFLTILFLLIRIKNKFVTKNYKILFFLSGFISSFPVIFHASQYLNVNGSLFSGGMGIILIKVIMVMFVFLPKRYTYTLYFLIDLITVLGYYFLANEIFLTKYELFIIYMILSDMILLIAYHVNLDLRKNNFLNRIEIAEINQELKDQMKFKERYFNLIAHDLKSPVNLMQSVIGLIKSGEINDERKSDYINKIDWQLESLNNLIKNVLDWIKTNNRQITLNPVKLKLSDNINKIIELNQELIDNKKIQINIENLDKELQIDIISLDIILNNLIRNAIKFSAKSEEININYDNYLLKIKNRGVEIDDKQIKDFYRSNISYAKNGSGGEKGHGLGLEIVKNLCDINNIKIDLRKDGNTTEFILDFNKIKIS